MIHRRLLALALIALVATATVFGGGQAEPEEAAAGAGGEAQQALTAAGDQWPNAAFKTGDFVYATPADFTEATGFEITSYQEAPELQARVTSGEIIGETALSFLGLGIRPPAVSWGALLKGAQRVNVVALYPWLLIPGLFVITTVIALSFLGDGLRDASDPYK